MKVFKLLILSLTIFMSLLCAEDAPTLEKEPSIFDKLIKFGKDGKANEEAEVAKKDKEENSELTTKSIYIKYNIPNRLIYKNSIFRVEYSAIILYKNIQSISSNFAIEESDNVEVLNSSPKWVYDSETNSYKTTYYMRTKEDLFNLPSISIDVKLKKGSITKTQESILGLQSTAISKTYLKLIGQDVFVKRQRVESLDEDTNIILLEIKGSQTDFTDFKITGVEEQGVKEINNSYDESTVVLYLLIPKEKPYVSFTYFDTKSNSYKDVKIFNVLDKQFTTAQSDINPKRVYSLFWLTVMISVITISLLYYIFTRKKVFLYLIIILVLYGGYSVLPTDTIMIRPNTKIYILPTKNSTVFVQLGSKDNLKARILKETKDYFKIEIGDDKIGWVKKSDIR